MYPRFILYKYIYSIPPLFINYINVAKSHQFQSRRYKLCILTIAQTQITLQDLQWRRVASQTEWCG